MWDFCVQCMQATSKATTSDFHMLDDARPPLECGRFPHRDNRLYMHHRAAPSATLMMCVSQPTSPTRPKPLTTGRRRRSARTSFSRHYWEAQQKRATLDLCAHSRICFDERSCFLAFCQCAFAPLVGSCARTQRSRNARRLFAWHGRTKNRWSDGKQI